MGVFNLNLPDISSNDNATITQQLQQIKSYVYMLNEQLRYHFSTIDDTNIIDGSIGEKTLAAPVVKQMRDNAGNISTLKQTSDSIKAEVKDISGNLAQINIEADNLLLRVQNNEGSISQIQLEANSLKSRVQDAEQNISTIIQTSESLQTEITNAKGDISTLQQTAQGIQTQVSNNKGNISTLQQTANSLTSRITSAENINNNQNTQISQNASAILLKADKTVTDELGTRLSSAEQKIKPDAIVSTVRSSTQYTQDLAGKQPKGDYATASQLMNYSTIEQTDSKIDLTVSGLKESVINVYKDGARERSFTRFYEIPVRNIFQRHIGEPVIISFEIKCSIVRRLRIYPYQYNGINISEQHIFTVNNANTWQRFVIKTYVKDFGIRDPSYSQGSIAFYDDAGSQSISLRRIKISFSSFDSGWSDYPVNPNLLPDSEKSWGGTSRFLSTYNIAPIFDKYGTGLYTISFDIKASSSGSIGVYCLRVGDAGTRYSIGYSNVYVTTNYARKSIIVEPVLKEDAISPYYANLCFYGGSTAISPSVKNIKIEAGELATEWIPYAKDPANSVKTSHITIEKDVIDIATGGKLTMRGGDVNLEAGSDMAIKSGANFDLTANDLVLSNNRSDGIAMMSGGNSIANAPYWLTREGELNFSKLSDGATAMLDNMFKVEFYSGSVAPDNSIGINGALYVLHSASVGSTWSDTAASIPSAQGMQTWFGVYRNWNVLESGCRYIGNGKGTASTKYGVYFTFSAPATMSNATFVFVTNKHHPTQSYYLSTGTTTYRLEIRSGSAAGSLVGRKDFSAGTSMTAQTVSVNGSFTKGTTYYCGIFYPESTELTNCTIVGGITLKGSSSSKEFGLYVKSNGSWKELIK